MAKEVSEKRNVTTISWQDLLANVEKNQGVPKKTVQESFSAVDKEIKTIIKDQRPKDGHLLRINTPVAAFAFDHIPSHTEHDKQGVKWNISESIRGIATLPMSYVELANEGFSLSRKKLKE